MTASPPPPPLRPTTFHVCLFGILCFCGAELGHFLAIPALYPEQPFWPIWPPSGLVLGWLLVCDRRSWPSLAAAAFVAAFASDTIMHRDSVPVALGDAFANTLEPLLGAWILRRLVPDRLSLLNFEHLLLLLLVGVLVGPALGAVPGSLSAVYLDGFPSLRDAYVRWWLADGIGVLTLAPIVIAWLGERTSPRIRNRGRKYPVELAAYCAFVLVMGVFMFHRAEEHVLAARFPFYVITPLLVWAGFRFELRGALLCIFVLGLTITWCTSQGFGLIARQGQTVTDQGLLIQAVLAQMTSLTLLFASSMERRVIAEARLRRESATLARVESEIRRQRDLLQSILDSMGEAVIVTDAAGSFVLRNPAADKLGEGGNPSTSIDDTRDRWIILEEDGVTYCPPEQWPLERALQGEDCDGVRLIIRSRRSGNSRDVLVSGRPIRAADGSISGAVVVLGDITPIREAEREQMKLIAQLQRALQEIKTLRGLIPICSRCKKIRNDTGAWERFEAYVSAHTGAEFTHGFCPECSTVLYGDLEWSNPTPPRAPAAAPTEASAGPA